MAKTQRIVVELTEREYTVARDVMHVTRSSSIGDGLRVMLAMYDKYKRGEGDGDGVLDSRGK